MHQRNRTMLSFLFLSLLCLLTGCGEEAVSPRHDYVREDLGIISLGTQHQNVEGKLLHAIEEAAKAEEFTSISYVSKGNREFSRTSYKFTDKTKNNISLDFVNRSDSDLRVTVTADTPLSEQFTFAIWKALAPQIFSDSKAQ